MTDEEHAAASADRDRLDLLYGVPAIAQFVGLREKQCRHRIDAKEIPSFKIGGTICARKSSLEAWIKKIENAGDGT